MEQVAGWQVLRCFGSHARRDEEFPILLTYRSEAEAEMLQVTKCLQSNFGERSVVHGNGHFLP